ncbi:MAG: thioredoxin [Ignavibacteriales bacterium]|nr:thioredoxin [Ignavibacteriales bacterium]
MISHLKKERIIVKPIIITDATFKESVLENDKLTIVDFWAEWCGPCRMIAPVLEEIASEYAGDLQVVKLNVDENPETPQTYGIRSIPTLLFFRAGNLVDRSIGFLPKEELKAHIERLFVAVSK